MILSAKDLGLLQKYLGQNSLLQAIDAEARRNLLVAIGLSDIADNVYLAAPPNSFAQQLVHKLIIKTLMEDGVERLGIVVLLDYLLASNGDSLLPVHRQFFEMIVEREPQLIALLRQREQRMQEDLGWPPEDLPAPGDESSKLTRTDELEQKKVANRHIPVDWDILTDFNLIDLSHRVSHCLRHYKGAYAFAVGGKEAGESVLRKYIVERLLREIERVTGREHRIHQFSINKYMHLQADRLLEFSQGEKDAPTRLNDMVSGISQDLVLVFYNYDIPTNTAKPLAQAFWESACKELEAFFKEDGRCFIVIWVHVRERPLRLERVVTLPIPGRLEVEDLKTYIKGRLGKYRDRLGEEVIERYLERLSRPQGHLMNTYREIAGMISELQDGRW